MSLSKHYTEEEENLIPKNITKQLTCISEKFSLHPEHLQMATGWQSRGKAAEDSFMLYFIRHGVLGKLTTFYVCQGG